MKHKVTLERQEHYRVLAVMEGPQYVGLRVKPTMMAEVEIVETDSEGYIYDLEVMVLTKGKMQGQLVELPPCKIKRVSVRKCLCPSYNFPHAPGFGACKLDKFEPQVARGVKLENLSTHEASKLNLEQLFIKDSNG